MKFESKVAAVAIAMGAMTGLSATAAGPGDLPEGLQHRIDSLREIHPKIVCREQFVRSNDLWCYRINATGDEKWNVVLETQDLKAFREAGPFQTPIEAFAEMAFLVNQHIEQPPAAHHSPLFDKLNQCKLEKTGSLDWRDEIPGATIVVDPARVWFGERDVDTFAEVDGLSWGAYRADEPLGKADQFIKRAVRENRMIRLTKVGQNTSAGFQKYNGKVQFEIIDQPVPETSDPVQAILEACENSPSQVSHAGENRNMLGMPADHRR